MENFILIIITLLAIYYIYSSTFKNKGCNCGTKSCPTNKDKLDLK